MMVVVPRRKKKRTWKRTEATSRCRYRGRRGRGRQRKGTESTRSTENPIRKNVLLSIYKAVYKFKFAVSYKAPRLTICIRSICIRICICICIRIRIHIHIRIRIRIRISYSNSYSYSYSYSHSYSYSYSYHVTMFVVFMY